MLDTLARSQPTTYGFGAGLVGFAEDVGVDHVFHRVSVDFELMGMKKSFSGQASSPSPLSIRSTSNFCPASMRPRRRNAPGSTIWLRDETVVFMEVRYRLNRDGVIVRGDRRAVMVGSGLMAAIKVDPARVLEFRDAASFSAWLAGHHDRWPEVWIKIHRARSGLASITPKEAIDVVLCWGWIDAVRKSFDERSFLQRYTPRGRRSIWSQINVDNVARLIGDGRMTEHGLRQVEAAKADGRWGKAYGSGKAMAIPDDLQAAIDAVPEAQATMAGLSAQNRFALAFRVHNMKTAAGRERKIGEFVAMLRRGETIYPQGKKR